MKTLFIYSLIFITFIAHAQTYVPDDNFEQALIDLGYDDVLDDYVVTDNINSINVLHIENKGIEDLTGIEDFVGLTKLYCGNNSLTELDLSNNTNLEVLLCSDNNIESLNVDANTLLKNLSCARNLISSLDIDNNIDLEMLYCDNNNLEYLNTVNNTLLKELLCSQNNISSLSVESNELLEVLRFDNNVVSSIDVSNNTVLRTLNCHNNSITELDLSSNPLIEILWCSGNEIDNLSCVDHLLSLRRLFCQDNLLTTLDVSTNTNLELLYCNNNFLTELDVRNTNNYNMHDIVYWDNGFDSTNNPDLTCVFVDNKEWSEVNWTYIDSTSTFVETEAECDAIGVEELSEKEILIYPNPTKNNFAIQGVEDVVNVDLLSMTGEILIKDLPKESVGYSINNVKRGVYVLRIFTLNNYYFTKLVVK